MKNFVETTNTNMRMESKANLLIFMISAICFMIDILCNH